MRLQRSAGNAAVAQYLMGSGGLPGGTLGRAPAAASLAREAAEAPPAGVAQNGAGGASPIAGLAKRVGSPAALRATLAANPALAQEIVGYFAAGNEDAELNALMASGVRAGDGGRRRARPVRARRRTRPTRPSRSRPSGRATRSSTRAR